MFRVRKWYLDCVTESGVAFIGYAARLRWGSFRAEHFSYLISAPDAALRETASWRAAALPKSERGSIRWSNPHLHITGHWQARCESVQRTLFTHGLRSVRWICHQPASYAVIQIGDVQLRGFGYAEELRLTIAPWRLPIDELQWGRYASEASSLVWIAWDGPHPRRLAFLNGSEVADPDIRPDGIRVRDRSLTFTETRTLRKSSLAAMLDAIPLAGKALARRFGATLEHKMLSRGALLPAAANDNGWIIHEVVIWHANP